MSKFVDLDIDALAEQLTPASRGRGRHSPLFRCLYEQADAFRSLLETTEPSWDAVTAALVQAGLTNNDGRPLTRRRVQKTWYSVVREKGWHQKPAPTPQLVVTVSPAPPSVDQSQSARDRLKARMKPITLSTQ